MTEDLDLVSRRGFLKGLMAASALVAVSPTLLAPVEALAGPAADTPPDVAVGDLWMRLEGQPWFFLGKTLAADVWTETEEYELDLSFYREPSFRGIARRSAYGRFEIAGDAETHKFLAQVMDSRDTTEFMVGHSLYPVRARFYVTNLVYTIEHGSRGLIRSRIDVTVTGPLEVVS